MVESQNQITIMHDAITAKRNFACMKATTNAVSAEGLFVIHAPMNLRTDIFVGSVSIKIRAYFLGGTIMYTPVLQDEILCSCCASKRTKKTILVCEHCEKKREHKLVVERRLRVIETARLLFVAPEHPDSTSTWDNLAENKKAFNFMLKLAEQFESAAEKYLETGEV